MSECKEGYAIFSPRNFVRTGIYQKRTGKSLTLCIPPSSFSADDITFVSPTDVSPSPPREVTQSLLPAPKRFTFAPFALRRHAMSGRFTFAEFHGLNEDFEQVVIEEQRLQLPAHDFEAEESKSTTHLVQNAFSWQRPIHPPVMHHAVQSNPPLQSSLFGSFLALFNFCQK